MDTENTITVTRGQYYWMKLKAGFQKWFRFRREGFVVFFCGSVVLGDEDE